MIGQPLTPDKIKNLGLNSALLIGDYLAKLQDSPISTSSLRPETKKAVHSAFQNINCEAGLIIPISIKEINEAVEKFHPLFSWRLDIKLNDFILIDRHIENFLAKEEKLPDPDIFKKIDRLLWISGLENYYDVWVEHSKHFILACHGAPGVTSLNWGLRIGSVIVNTLKIYLALLENNLENEAKLVKKILEIMTTGNIPLGTLDSPAIRRTLLIVE